MKRPNTLFVGQVFHDLPQVASTNEHALFLLSKNKPPEGTVISTFCQTDGRGQIGSKWESQPGKNITLSVIFYPEFLLAKNQFRLNQAISLATHDFVKTYLPEEVRIKWPNDIYVRQLKIAGILIQNSLSNNYIRSSVVGIGINVNQTMFLTSPPNPTSFALETGWEFDLEELVLSLCQFIESRYLQLKSGKIVPLHRDYLQGLYLFEVPSLFQRASGEVFQGTITGIDESGKILLSVGGEEEAFDLKEMKFL